MHDKPRVWWLQDDVVVGRCKGCGLIHPAIGLIETPDRVAFGRPIDGGWYCSQCKPRTFGKERGGRAMGWEMPPLPGQVIPESKIVRGMREMMPLGTPRDKVIVTRKRKIRPMRRL